MLDEFLRHIKEILLVNFVSLLPQYITPNVVTVFSLICGIISSYYCVQNQYYQAFYYWCMNRFLDGLDGVVARARNLQTDFGGYLDIICDFIVYSAIPICIAYQKQNIQIYFMLAIMLGTFFVNSASLFYLSALFQKKITQKDKQELTSITMPPALIEGSETVIAYSLFIIFNEYVYILFAIFSLGVSINIVQRLILAKIKL